MRTSLWNFLQAICVTQYMALTMSPAGAREFSPIRPLVAGLFLSSCLLSIVSWYTTQQGMALYLSAWFSFVASLGVQSALVLVAWLIGFTKTNRALLIAVYAVTAAISISFSYVSLYTWFSSRERPAPTGTVAHEGRVRIAAVRPQRISCAFWCGFSHGRVEYGFFDE